MPHVRPTSHHRGQPDRGWTPHRRHGNGSRPMHMDWTACLLESSTMMRPAVRSVHEAGGNFVAVRSGASPRLRPYMNPGRKNRGSPSARIGISMRTTPSNATEPSLRTVTVQRHGSAGDPFPPCQSTSTARPHSSRRTYRPAPSARRAEHSRAIPASLYTSLLISFSYLRKTLPSCAKTILKYIVTIVKSFVK